jgi:sortase A
MRQGNRMFGTAIIVIGLVMISIPLVNWGVSSYRQYKALAAWEQQMPVLEPIPEAAEELEEPQVEGEPEPETPPGLPEGEGLLSIPKIKVTVVVRHGVTEDDLKLGPGFYPQSNHPEIGNVSIASHRGSHGSYFLRLNRLVEGDDISLIIGGKLYRYKVTKNYVTNSRDWSVVESVGVPEITLTTCVFNDLSKRLIVKAELVDAVETVQGE